MVYTSLCCKDLASFPGSAAPPSLLAYVEEAPWP